MKTKTYKVVVPLELADMIDEVARQENRTSSDLIRRLMDQFIFGVSRRYAAAEAITAKPKRVPRVNFTAAERAEIFRRDSGQCAYCDGPLRFEGDSWHIDHIKPLCKGGTNELDNLTLSCARCNLKKSGKEVAGV